MESNVAYCTSSRSTFTTSSTSSSATSTAAADDQYHTAESNQYHTPNTVPVSEQDIADQRRLEYLQGLAAQAGATSSLGFDSSRMEIPEPEYVERGFGTSLVEQPPPSPRPVYAKHGGAWRIRDNHRVGKRFERTQLFVGQDGGTGPLAGTFAPASSASAGTETDDEVRWTDWVEQEILKDNDGDGDGSGKSPGSDQAKVEEVLQMVRDAFTHAGAQSATPEAIEDLSPSAPRVHHPPPEPVPVPVSGSGSRGDHEGRVIMGDLDE